MTTRWAAFLILMLPMEPAKISRALRSVALNAAASSVVGRYGYAHVLGGILLMNWHFKQQK